MVNKLPVLGFEGFRVPPIPATPGRTQPTPSESRSDGAELTGVTTSIFGIRFMSFASVNVKTLAEPRWAAELIGTPNPAKGNRNPGSGWPRYLRFLSDIMCIIGIFTVKRIERHCIQIWNLGAMTTQIAVRLPDELVDELDTLIAAGRDTSRVSVVEEALRRELRRRLWEREVEKLIASGDTYEDLAGMNEFAFGTAVLAD